MNAIWAQLATPETVETVFRWTRIQENRDWFLPAMVVGLLLVYFWRRYRIDAAELRAWQRFFLFALRCGAVAGLLLFYLHPQWEHLVASSRVAVLIDTSASMAGRDLVAPEEKESASEEPVDSIFNLSESESRLGPTRLEGLVDWVRRSELLEKLAEKHEVVVYAFDGTARRLNEKDTKTDPENPAESSETVADPLDMLKAEGPETCLGEALFEVFQRERGQPLAGIVLLGDGGQNAGRAVEPSLETAAKLRIPIFPVGVGVVHQPLNFRVGNLNLPERAFPGDPFTIRVPVEMLGSDSAEDDTRWTIPVELWAAPLSDGTEQPETKLTEKEITFSAADGDGALDTEFEIRIAEPGRQRLTIKLQVPQEDHIPADDHRQSDIEVIDRKDRILLFASAPTRDYQFLCSQIYRDKSMTVDVYLPWAKPGISQNADKILDRFPATRAEMAEYDIVIAFDPDWRVLSPEQIENLEYWVARQGGGLILFAGTVHQADGVAGWVTDMGMDKIRALYPVEFHARQTAFEHRYHGDAQPWPLRLTRAGEGADFLKPVDDPVEARTFWSEFPGFYGYFGIRGVKPTATLLAASGSPETLGRDETGALIVEQFYGSGRVLYFGSGELWRLRRTDEGAYERIATRILRHAAQGRLQRESDRGSLATDKQRYSLGSTAQLRITAADARLEPLTLPTLPVDVISPSGTLRTIEVSLDPNLPGTYQGHLPLTEEGDWSVRFTLRETDGAETDQQLSRTVQVRMSDLEREHPNRNEPLLRDIAAKTGGAYYVSPTEAMPLIKESALFGNLDLFAAFSRPPDDEPVRPLTELLKVRSHRAVPDATAGERISRYLLLVICGLLLLEWTSRRLMKLA